jgi:3-deoxy-D-manno-octulosonate 8-phosphate phosphatase (KDO 8-P phosphatase)
MTSSEMEKIRLLLLDVDGVLTDGGIIYSNSGSEIKVFNVKDGLGIRLLIEAGIRVGIVSGRESGALRCRCRDLGIDDVYENVSDKRLILPQILEKAGVAAGEVAFMGDDLPDIPLMKAVGLSIAVSDAPEAVRSAADWITAAKGGCGAVREVCESLLKAQGRWEAVLEGF